MENEIKSKIKRGLSWAFLNQFVIQVALVGFNIYLTRILDPKIFGIVGIVTVFSNFAVFFVDAGFATALVQKKEVNENHLSTVFWTNLLIGVFFFLIFFFGAPFLARFYGEPLLEPVTKVTGLVFIFSSLGIVQNSLLVKRMDFKMKSILNWIATLIAYCAAVVLALYNFGVWSIVVLNIAIVAINSLLLWIFSKWRPQFIFSGQSFRELFSVGGNVLGDSLVNYWSRNADNFLIGKYVGSEGLGIYSRAYTIMLLPIRNISSVIVRVLFPAFSEIQDNLAKIRGIYLKTIRYIAYVTFPAMFGLAALASEFVMVFFGEKWLAMIPIIRWLAVLGAFQSIISLNGVIYNSLGKANIAFRVSIVVNIILIASFIIGIWAGGLMGLTIAYFIAGTVLSIPIYYIAINQIELSLKDALRTLMPTTLACVLMVSVILVIQHFLTVDSALITLLVCAAAGGLVFIATMFVVDSEFKRLVLTRKP